MHHHWSYYLKMPIPFIIAALWSWTLLLPVQLNAAEVQLLLLSSQKAIFLVDGERRVLEPGEASPEGVELIAIEEEKAVVRIGEETRHLDLSRKWVGQNPPSPETSDSTPNSVPEHRVYVDNQGMFLTTGSINGFPVDFIVDTGATTVVLNASAAKRLGINFRRDGKIVAVTTASRRERGYLVKLRSVKLGQIEVFNVDATVIDGSFPPRALLGMSFLGRLESQRTPTTLLLRKRY